MVYLDVHRQLVLLEASSFSYPKKSHQGNEDAILPAILKDDCIFMALADGVGGRIGGNIAAQGAIGAIKSCLSTQSNIAIETLFDAAKQQIEQLAASNTELAKMATTLIVCKISQQGIEVANVGDSRAYVVEHNSLRQISKDHTQKQQLIDQGIISAKELKGHPFGNRLTNSLRCGYGYQLDKFTLHEQQGSVILMSDGAYKFIEHTRVVGNDGADDLLNICCNIKKRVIKRGPVDDYSLVAASFNWRT